MTTWRARAAWFGGLVVMALAGSHAPVGAQRVVGRVLERGGGGPVAGAMVRLATDAGLLGNGWLTGRDGRFRLDATSAGTYRIRVERIGFRTTVLEGVAQPVSCSKGPVLAGPQCRPDRASACW